MSERKGKSSRNRYSTYAGWIKDTQKKKLLKSRLEQAGVPLELRATTILEKQGFHCSSFHFKDQNTGKYRELDIYASKVNVTSFEIGGCLVVFNVLILAECKYSYYWDFLAFGREDKHLPNFPVVFTGSEFLAASYQDFEFPMIIRKVAETDVGDLENKQNFHDPKTHEACEKLIACFSQVYERKRKSTRIDLDKYRLHFESAWKKFLLKTPPIADTYALKQTIGDFLKNYEEFELLNEIPYFNVEISFPMLIIPQERGLIRVTHDKATGQIVDFEDVGYGVYPFVSECADKYDNVLKNYFEFPILVCNLGCLDDCMAMLKKGLDKMAAYAKTLLQNNPKAVAREVLERIFETTSIAGIVEFMGIEELRITDIKFINDHMVIDARNTGSTPVTIKEVSVNGTEQTYTPQTIEAGTAASIDLAYHWTAGASYQIKFVSVKGNSFIHTAVAT